MSRMIRYMSRAEDQGDSGQWLVTFTDMMALMLTFFVLTFAMSNPDVEQWDGLTDNVQDNFNRYYGEAFGRGEQDSINIERVDFAQALDLDYLKKVLEDGLSEQKNAPVVTFRRTKDSLILSLPAGTMFDKGNAALSEEGSRALYTLVPVLRRIKNRIEIAGYADERTQGDAGWVLSLDRAAAAGVALVDAGYERPLVLRGAGGAGADKADPARRLEIVIMEDDGKRVTIFDIDGP